MRLNVLKRLPGVVKSVHDLHVTMRNLRRVFRYGKRWEDGNQPWSCRNFSLHRIIGKVENIMLWVDVGTHSDEKSRNDGVSRDKYHNSPSPTGRGLWCDIGSWMKSRSPLRRSQRSPRKSLRLFAAMCLSRVDVPEDNLNVERSWIRGHERVLMKTERRQAEIHLKIQLWRHVILYEQPKWSKILEFL